MNDDAASLPVDSSPADFDSRDCVNIFLDFHMEKISRPSRPALIEAARKEKERHARWRKESDDSAGNDNQAEKNGETTG